MKVKCPRCGTTQDTSSRFCSGCGSSLANILPPKRNYWKVGAIILAVCLFLGWFALIKDADTRKRQEAAAPTPYDKDIAIIGEKPLQSSLDGSVLPVKRYLERNLNDYNSSEFVEWSPVSKVKLGNELYWGVRLKLRAKNAFGGYILRDTYYYMRHDEVVIAKGLSGE